MQRNEIMKHIKDHWDDLIKQEISLTDIKENSPLFNIMQEAANNGIHLAQHNMGMWNELVKKDYDEALRWYGKAASSGFEESAIAYTDLVFKITNE